jgi:hypothetical protein
MKFPIIILRNNEAPIYFVKGTDEFGLISKNGEYFYTKGVLYDSEGTKFSIDGIRSIRKASILKTLRYLQPMYTVDVKYTTVEKVALSDFKQIVIKHIHSFKKYWIQRDSIQSLETSIAEKNNFLDLINFLQ